MPNGISPRGADLDVLFDELWAAYPKRDGANPKQPARHKFVAALRGGADPREIIAGAKRYAAEAVRLQHAGTPLVAQMTTWLNQKRWQDYPPGTGTDPPNVVRMRTVEEIMAEAESARGKAIQRV